MPLSLCVVCWVDDIEGCEKTQKQRERKEGRKAYAIKTPFLHQKYTIWSRFLTSFSRFSFSTYRIFSVFRSSFSPRIIPLIFPFTPSHTPLRPVEHFQNTFLEFPRSGSGEQQQDHTVMEKISHGRGKKLGHGSELRVCWWWVERARGGEDGKKNINKREKLSCWKAIFIPGFASVGVYFATLYIMFYWGTTLSSVYSRTPAQRGGLRLRQRLFNRNGVAGKNEYIQFTPCQRKFKFASMLGRVLCRFASHTLSRALKLLPTRMRDHVSSYTIIDDLIFVIGSCFFLLISIDCVTSLVLGMKPIF